MVKNWQISHGERTCLTPLSELSRGTQNHTSTKVVTATRADQLIEVTRSIVGDCNPS